MVEGLFLVFGPFVIILMATGPLVIVLMAIGLFVVTQYNFSLISSIVSRPGVLGDQGDLGVLGA